MKEFTAFFRLYYNYFKGNMKECEKILHEENFNVTVTPLVGFVIHVLSGLFILSYVYSIAMLIWIPILVGNLVFTHNLSERFYMERMRRFDEDMKKMWEEFDRAWEKSQQNQKQQYQKQSQQRQHTSKLDTALRFLGLTKSATKADVKKAYRTLAKKHHPDMGGNKSDFIKLKEHYDYAMSQL